jgi:NTP pyrophosphatase (non-canonical NTP hydrolase)
MQIGEVQARAWANKQARGFNTEDAALEFGLLTAEVSEAFTAWRKGLPDLCEELADVAIYLAGLAEMAGVDLEAAVADKLNKNSARTYARNGSGALVRVADPAEPASR